MDGFDAPQGQGSPGGIDGAGIRVAYGPSDIPGNSSRDVAGQSVQPSRDRQVAADGHLFRRRWAGRSEEHTSELQSLMRISYAVFCLKKKIKTKTILSKQS